LTGTAAFLTSEVALAVAGHCSFTPPDLDSDGRRALRDPGTDDGQM
jgi:hypothetical protein